jgi:ankyrin repeat protein
MESMQLLVDANADVNLGSAGSFPLTNAINRKNLAMVKILLNANADVGTVDHHGQTPLMLATKVEHLEIVQLLVQAGADINAQAPDGTTALDRARESNSTDLVGILGNVEERLVEAARAGKMANVTEILEKGVNINYQDRTGSTALHVAVRGGHADVARKLVRAGADMAIVDKEGQAIPDIDPWMVAETIGAVIHRQLGEAPSADTFLAVLRSFPAACVFAVDTVDLTDSAMAAIRDRLTESLLETVNEATRVRSGDSVDREISTTDLDDFEAVDALLTEFCDLPIERLRRTGHSDRIAVPRWLESIVVAATFAAFSREMDAKKKLVGAAPELVEAFRVDAQLALADDRTIYEAVLEKMTNKHAKQATEILRRAAATRKEVKGRFKVRPTQPGLSKSKATLLDLKVQAAKTTDDFADFMTNVFVPQAKAHDVGVTLAPVLKKASRIQQKWWLRGDVVSICDVVRALATVPTFDELLAVHIFLMGCREIEVVDFKDRLNQPTSGGWADLVYLFRINGSTGHICELQLALEPLVTARSSLHGHAAYASARHKIEILSSLGISVTDAPPLENPDSPVSVTPTSDEVTKLEPIHAALSRENAALLEENARLRKRIEALEARSSCCCIS